MVFKPQVEMCGHALQCTAQLKQCTDLDQTIIFSNTLVI